DAGGDLLDDAHVLVTKGDARLRGGAPFVHVQVGAADGAGGDADDDVGGILDRRVLDVLDGDLVGAFVDDGFHDDPSCAAAESAPPGFLFRMLTTWSPRGTPSLRPRRRPGPARRCRR